jgi:hypothetical protein
LSTHACAASSRDGATAAFLTGRRTKLRTGTLFNFHAKDGSVNSVERGSGEKNEKGAWRDKDGLFEGRGRGKPAAPVRFSTKSGSKHRIGLIRAFCAPLCTAHSTMATMATTATLRPCALSRGAITGRAASFARSAARAPQLALPRRTRSVVVLAAAEEATPSPAPVTSLKPHHAPLHPEP